MPTLPKVVTDAAERATGADYELTPLTAQTPATDNVWRQRFERQVNRSQQRAPPTTGEAASYYDQSSRFSPASVELPRKVRVTQKKKLSKWRVIFMTVFVLSVMINVTFITLFVYWYVKVQEFRDLWNKTMMEVSTPYHSPTPTAGGTPDV
jgi:hypothetical protein